ncbi:MULTISPECIES: hypothetical protein [Myxococcus]|uniref:hypothetical protein n=1 Tax=Myxococcus TaxID=32 RepID=UPI001E31C113|nr:MULTISPECIES: hypothetical protein [Myxococcus]
MDEVQELEALVPKPEALGFSGGVERARHEMHGPFTVPPGPEAFSFAPYQSTGVGQDR